MKTRWSLGLVVISIACLKMADAEGNRFAPVDKKFVLAVAADGMTQVKLGEIARNRATSPSIKEFAETMVSDHSRADDDLNNIAAAHYMQIPTELDATHQAQVDRVVKLSEGQFDQAYLDQVITDHKKAVTALEAEQDTKQSDLKDWTDRTLPTIKHHLNMILSIKSKVPKAL